MIPTEGSRMVLFPVPAQRRRSVRCAALLGVLTALLSGPARGYTPDSPEVQDMLAPAMQYLEQAHSDEAEMLGGKCLLGLAAYKYNKRFGNQPDALPRLTQAALTSALQAVNKLDGENNYSVGIALILLCEIHAQDHIQAIDVYVQELLERQKPHGGWGYLNQPTGDLSQLQYAVLGLWSAKNAGLQSADQAMADVVNYTIRVQDPSGAWGYQGKDPGNYTRVAQTSIRPSLCAAGLGTLYVGADYLGMSKSGTPRTISSDLPTAFRPVVEREDGPSGMLAGAVEVSRLKQAMEDGRNWFRNLNSLETQLYQYYFIYGLERYHSFREKVEGTYEEEPDWYNRGVRLLLDKQNRDGSWGVFSGLATSPSGTSPPIATSFAMLFLLRSTRETIEQVIERDGLLQGGHGLPGDLTEIRIRNNRIVAPAITGEVEDLITMLEDEEGEKIENMLENPDALSLSGLSGSGREYTERLSRILRTGKSYQARIVAARTLGQQGELDNVPILIYALTDPDFRVVREARDALRLISRRFGGFGLSDRPTRDELDAAIERWKAWYRSIRPDALFIQ